MITAKGQKNDDCQGNKRLQYKPRSLVKQLRFNRLCPLLAYTDLYLNLSVGLKQQLQLLFQAFLAKDVPYQRA